MRSRTAGPVLLATTIAATALAGCPSRPLGGRATPRDPVADAPTRSAALPGRCVDPLADTRARLGEDAGEGDLHVERTTDLDGDGVLDPFVTHASFCGTGGCTWHLFVARGACAHHVGVLFGVLPSSRPATSHGLVDLEISARDGCAGMARTETRARFDGTEYVQHEVRRCDCPSEPPEGEHDDWDPDAFCEPWRSATEPSSE